MPIIEAQTFSAEVLARFDKELAKYPSDQKQSAVIACLSIVQQVHGHVSPEGEKGVAQYLGMPVMAVHEVSTFYNMFNLKPVGRFKINVCTNLPCQLRGGQKPSITCVKSFMLKWVAPPAMACLHCSHQNAWAPVLMHPFYWSMIGRCAVS